MQYEFLKHFPKRMKNVGLYTLLIQNSVQKTTWKQYGFLRADEQLNLIFAVLLYMMEQSLKEEICTLDEIGAYIDTINMQYLKKQMSYEECRQLGDFIVNVILSNEGRVMYFDGYDFEENAYQTMHISYVANRIVYVEQDFRRTSYYLTDDGYNLLLGTLEIENNMKLTIHEMIFQMHLEKQSYDKAVDEIKNVFNLLRIQLQKIQEAMEKIRRNALTYSVRDYEELLENNLDTISETKKKFQNYRELVKNRVKELEDANINVKKLLPKEEENLNHLREIGYYLTRAIDEHQKILNHHFDLKALYTRELENLTQMTFIQRFSLRTKLYDPLLQDAAALENLEYFLRPLFQQDPAQIYNLNKAFQFQKVTRRKEEVDTEEELSFDAESWRLEQAQIKQKKLLQYEGSLRYLLAQVANRESGEISLLEIQEEFKQESEKQRNLLIPTVEIFKEIMVELIKNKEIDLDILRQERREYIQETSEEFQLNEMILQLIEEDARYADIHKIQIFRKEDAQVVVFEQVWNELGQQRTIRCSNVVIRIVRELEKSQ